MVKSCTRCGESKPVAAFHLYPNGRPKSWCKTCQIEYVNQKRAATPKILKRSPNGTRKPITPQERKKHSLKNKFGITIDEYDALLTAQNGVCAICGRAESKIIRGRTLMLSVDHCHQTGKVRGLLCHSCNVGLGQFRDSQELLTNALNYLRHCVLPRYEVAP